MSHTEYIFKIERPIASGSDPWLVYDQRRQHFLQLTPDVVPDKLKRAMGDDFKIYCRGSVNDENGQFMINFRRIEGQSW